MPTPELSRQTQIGHVVDNVVNSVRPVCEAALTIDKVTRLLEFDLLSNEGRLVVQLMIRRTLIIKEAWLASQLSHRAFHALLRRMESSGIVRVAASNTDRRTKIIALHPDFIARFLQKWPIDGMDI